MSEQLTRAGVSLRDVLDDAQVVGGKLSPVTSCTSDWQQVQPGDVYVALVESNLDGHDFATEAVESGAAAVVCERHLPVFGVPQLIVDDSRQAYGRICQALVGHPCHKLKVIGVTGTAGKSSVVALVESVLHAAGGCVGSLGTLGYTDRFDHVATANTTPSQTTLAHWLARMVATDCSHAVVELSSEGLAESRAAGLELDAVCITNIDRDHLDTHASLQNYRRAKERILEHLQPHGVAVLNADDPHCCRMLSDITHPVLTFGIDQPAEVTAVLVEQFVGEQTFIIMAGTDSAAVRTRIIGKHHLTNCLAAATIGLAYGIDLQTIARGLEAVERIPGRMDRVEFGQQYGLWIDAADSPQQLTATLDAVRAVTPGRVICSLLPRARYGPGERRALHRVAQRLADVSIITDGKMDSTPHAAAQTLSNYADAIAWALRRAEPGDAVMVAASSEAIAGRLATDDLALVKRWLREVALASEITKAAA